MFRGRVKAGLAVVLLPLAIVAAGCGSSSNNSSSASSSAGASSSGSSSAAAGTGNVAAASATVAQYTGKPTAFPVNLPLKKRPTGQTLAYLQCSTPVCGLFAQLLPPTASILGYKLIVDKGASASGLQSAMSSIIAQKPNGILLTAITPDQFSSQLKQAVSAKISMAANGVMNPQQYGIDASNFDQRLSLLAGKLLADQVISANGSKANSVFYTIPELDFTSYERKGYAAEMARLCPSCTNRYVPIPVATVGNTAPTQVVDDLQSHPATKTAVFASEETVAGLPAALKAAGLNVKVTGFAPDPTALSYIKSGQISSGLGLDLGVMIWEEVDELVRETTHQPLTAGERAGAVPIQFLYQKDLTGDVSKGWSAYPDFMQRFTKLWTGK